MCQVAVAFFPKGNPEQNEERPSGKRSGRLRRNRERWTVERLFAWLQVFRRLGTRYVYHIENFLGMV